MKIVKDREQFLWVLGFSICTIFQFWRKAPIDGYLFIVFTIGLIWVGNNEKIKTSREKITKASPMAKTRNLYIGLFIAGCIWELLNYIFGYFKNNEDAYPTISMLVMPFISHFWGLITFLIIYLSLGWKLIFLHKVKK